MLDSEAQRAGLAPRCRVWWAVRRKPEQRARRSTMRSLAAECRAQGRATTVPVGLQATGPRGLVRVPGVAVKASL